MSSDIFVLVAPGFIFQGSSSWECLFIPLSGVVGDDMKVDQRVAPTAV